MTPSNFSANFDGYFFVGTVPHAGNIRLKEILKRRALFGNQTVVLRGESSSMRITVRLKEIKKRRALIGIRTVELLTNSSGKRTVVLLNPSFFYFFNPFFVSGNPLATVLT